MLFPSAESFSNDYTWREVMRKFPVNISPQALAKFDLLIGKR
jgi:hypothetical protein